MPKIRVLREVGPFLKSAHICGYVMYMCMYHLPCVKHPHACQLCYDRLNLPFSYLVTYTLVGKKSVHVSARFNRSLIDERITNPAIGKLASKFLHHMFKLCIEFL